MAMRTKHVLTVLAVVLLALTAVAGPTLSQGENQALLRFVHAIAGSGAVDIYANDTLAISGLEAGATTPHLTIPAGDYSLRVTEADGETALWEQEITVAAGTAQTLVAVASEPPAFLTFQDDLASLGLGTTRFTAIHAIPDGPAVDILLADGRPVVSGLEAGQIYGTLDLPSLAYDFAVVPAGASVDEAIVPVTTYALTSGTSHVLVIYGSAENPQTLLLDAPATGDAAAGYIRLVHAYPGAGSVDVFINDSVAAPALAYGSDATAFVAVPAGDYEVTFREANTTTDLATTSVTLGENQYATVAIYPADGDVTAQAFTSEIATATEREAVVNIANLLSEGATTFIGLNNGTPLSGDVPAGQNSAAVVEPVETGATVSVMDGEQTTDLALLLDTIYGGAYYDVLVVPAEDGPEAIVLEPVAVAQSFGSAPGAAVDTVDTAAPEDVTTEEATAEESSEVVADEPTPAPVDAPAETEAAPVPTEAPQVEAVEPTPEPAAPTAAPTEVPPVARVLLDPGANLQMRQYPNSQALSLGLAPAGAELTVIGREGAPVLMAFETPDPEATEWIDPASLLGDGEFLDRLETWLFVSYPTEDGGQIDAWVNSFYVSVHAPNGDLVPLHTLPTVPSNQAGEAHNTVVGPPTIEQPVPQAVVGGLDEGVNLQIRRTPDVAGESLTLVPNGTALDLLGMNEERSWAFVRYETEDGSVTGWTNALFLVEYTYQDQPLTFDTLESRNLIETIDESERGREAGEVAPPVAPTRDPQVDVVLGEVLLDPGANLQFRRNPNTQAESLGLVPAGEQIVITGRTEDGTWLQAEFDGRTGWVAAAYIGLTFNGRAYNAETLPVEGTGVAPVSPDATAEATSEASQEPTAEPALAEISVDVVAMTYEPGGNGDGLPVLTRGREVYFFFNSDDGLFSLIQPTDMEVTGWVPSNSLFFR